MSTEVVSLASLCNGAVLELFQNELVNVITNIADPNTSAKTVRKIKIEVLIKPDEDRTAASATVEVTAKLAGVKPQMAALFFGKRDGKLIAVTSNLSQPSMFDEQPNNITPLKAVGRETA